MFANRWMKGCLAVIIEISSPTHIAEGTRLSGELSFTSSVQVFGVIDGGIIQTSYESVEIGRSGWVNGSIQSKGPIRVEGRVEGEIHSETLVRLSPSALVKGKIIAPRVEILAGALFDGALNMGFNRPLSPSAKAA